MAYTLRYWSFVHSFIEFRALVSEFPISLDTDLCWATVRVLLRSGFQEMYIVLDVGLSFDMMVGRLLRSFPCSLLRVRILSSALLPLA